MLSCQMFIILYRINDKIAAYWILIAFQIAPAKSAWWEHQLRLRDSSLLSCYQKTSSVIYDYRFLQRYAKLFPESGNLE